MNPEVCERIVRANVEKEIVPFLRAKDSIGMVTVVAVRELPDPFFATSLNCNCESRHETCEIIKTGFIFNTDLEALDYGKEWLKEIRSGGKK